MCQMDTVIGIVDASGNIVVEYKYDAWGKIIARTGSLASSLMQMWSWASEEHC